MWGRVEVPRFQYDPPWYKPQWRDLVPKVRVYRHGDEYCNSTLYIRMPFLGNVTVWRPWGRLRQWPCPVRGEDESVPLCPTCHDYHAPHAHAGETHVFVQVQRWYPHGLRQRWWVLSLAPQDVAPRGVGLPVRRYRDAERRVREYLAGAGVPGAHDEESVFIYFLW